MACDLLWRRCGIVGGNGDRFALASGRSHGRRRMGLLETGCNICTGASAGKGLVDAGSLILTPVISIGARASRVLVPTGCFAQKASYSVSFQGVWPPVSGAFGTAASAHGLGRGGLLALQLPT